VSRLGFGERERSRRRGEDQKGKEKKRLSQVSPGGRDDTDGDCPHPYSQLS
jgi:hypothetical protein